MQYYFRSLKEMIGRAKVKAAIFFQTLEHENYGWRYTLTHEVEKYPAATLYGTWSAILGLTLLKDTPNWAKQEKDWAISKLNFHRRADGTFLGKGLENFANSKSLEYLILHCTNYSLGAALELDPNFDFETPYLHRFLVADNLAKWLDGRSLMRPWEEGNNIVNVASYLALCHEQGITSAMERLYQLLEWHRKYQNPKTGGFDCFGSPSFNQRLQSLAGAVHNFHIHLYLGEPFGCESVIAEYLPRFLTLGRLSACESIDFVELAIRTIEASSDQQELTNSLIYHAHFLLNSQREDGGWLEADNNYTPTAGHGFKDSTVSSCSYATWFRLCALGMISIVLLDDDPKNWGFRKTLGMGYAPDNWPARPNKMDIKPLSPNFKLKAYFSRLPSQLKARITRLGVKILS
ncbi:MAG: hypothetical protein PHW74_06545 [Desulfobacca sp.]|nr:hypothetical protein [Desulfobacca sp.]